MSELKRKSKRMSMSGIIERTRIKGILKFTLRSFPDALPNKYASAICPTANEFFPSLKSKHLVGYLLNL
jgi:hypothetical protein